MNISLPEMLHSFNTNSGEMEMSVLERQRARINWQQEQFIQQQQQQEQRQRPVSFFEESGQLSSVFLIGNGDQGLGELLPGTVNRLNYCSGSGFEMGCDSKGKEHALSYGTGEESLKKRKAEKNQNLKVVAEEKSLEKKMKGCEEDESKITDQNSNSKSTTTSAGAGKNYGTSVDNSKALEFPKTDYIHVRARRGQATDSHSLAERVRREKISERMKYLQDLVPGCNKITGKAGMLDEIINYVQSLQRQVEFLSMKLAVVNPRLDFEIDNNLAKEMFPACTSSIPSIGISTDTINPDHVQFNGMGQGIQFCGQETGLNPPDLTLRRTISTPVSIPETLLDSSCLSHIQPLTWDAEMHNLYSMEYHQGRSTQFVVNQPFTGFIESGNVKLEM